MKIKTDKWKEENETKNTLADKSKPRVQKQ